jgi:DNA-binding MarR family transcriptional regulator
MLSSIMNKHVDNVNHLRDSTESDALELMHSVMHLVRARLGRSEDNSEPSIGDMERRALGFFARHPGASQSDLVLHSRRDKGQIARLIAGLKERKLLEAKPDSNDLRIIRLYPTQQSQLLHAEFMRRRKKISIEAVAGLTKEQARELLALLKHVEQNLRKE